MKKQQESITFSKAKRLRGPKLWGVDIGGGGEQGGTGIVQDSSVE